MGGLSRRRARGILVLGGLAILVPFLDLGGSSERPAAGQAEVRAQAVPVMQTAERSPSPPAAATPVTPVALEGETPVPEKASLHLLVAD